MIEAPLGDDPRKPFLTRQVAAAICVAACPFLLILLLDRVHPMAWDVDYIAYLSMAEGHAETIPKPFSNRLLVPAAARGIAHVVRVPVGTAFRLIALIALFAFLYACAAMMLKAGWGLLAAAVALPCPLLLSSYHNIHLPDMPHAAMTAVLLLLLRGQRWIWVLALVMALQTTREATLLMAVILAILCFMRSSWKLGFAVFASCTAGGLLVAFVTRHYPPNIHSMGTLSYLLAKLPFNLAKNVFGAIFWADTLPPVAGVQPVWTMPVPHWLPMGAMHRVGFLRFSANEPLDTLSSWLTGFGLAPALFFAAFRRSQFRAYPMYIQLGIVYGFISFFVAPGLGASVDRLIFYGWPVFYVGVPWLLGRKVLPRSVAIRLLLVHVGLCWGSAAIGGAEGLAFSMRMAIRILLALPLHVYAYWLVKDLPDAIDDRRFCQVQG